MFSSNHFGIFLRLLLAYLSYSSLDVIASTTPEPHSNYLKILHPPFPKDFDKHIPNHTKNHYIYTQKLIHTLLDHSGRKYKLVPSSGQFYTVEQMTAGVKQGKLSLSILNTDTHWEDRLRAIRYPIYKGLIGWRLFLIRSDTQSAFSQIERATQIKKFIAGQGYHWPDTHILEQNHFKVRKALDFNALTHLLEQGHIDYFPRGIFEIEQEYLDISKTYPNLAIEQHLALYYPAAVYFFVAKDNMELATAMENGFKAIIKNGVWDKLFEKYFGDTIRYANLPNRKIFRLKREGILSDIETTNRKIWYTPDLRPNNH